MGLSSKPTDINQKREDSANASSNEPVSLSSKKPSLNADLGPEKSVTNIPEQFSFLIQCNKHEGWQTTSKSATLQDAINTFSDLAINGRETGIRLIKVTLGPDKSQNHAEVVFRIEGEELVAASKGNFDLTRLGKSLLTNAPQEEKQPEAHDPHDLLAPVPDADEKDNLLFPPLLEEESHKEDNDIQSSNDDHQTENQGIGFPPLQSAQPRRNGKKSLLTIIAWFSLFVGSAAVGVTLSDIPTKKIVEKLEAFIPLIGDGYKSLIHEEDSESKTVEAGTLGAKNSRDILKELQGDYSPNLLEKTNSAPSAEIVATKSTPDVQVSAPAAPLIAPPPVADLVLKSTGPTFPQDNPPLVTNDDMQSPVVVKTDSTDAQLKPIDVVRAPQKPEPPQANMVAEAVESPVIAETEIIPIPVKPSDQTLILEDLIMGFTWSDTKESLRDSVLNFLNITESIEGCRMDVESWLSDTRYIVGLFNREKGGKLIALQIDSQPFLTTSYALKSFEDATNAIVNKLPNNVGFLKEVEVAEKQNLFSILSSDKQARHYRHWSLVDLNVPAYIHLSVKAIDQSSGFHRTIIAAVTE